MPRAKPLYPEGSTGYGTSTVNRARRTRAEIVALDEALVEITAAVAPATVRQIFYQAVVRDLVPKDETRGYRTVQRRLLALREAGALPYGWITDNSRLVMTEARFGGVEDFASEVAGRYRKDYWLDSPVRVEIWLEKDALAGVLYPTVVREHGLDLFVTKGFASVTYLQEAAQFINHDGRPTYLYLLTEFDPSGLGIADTVTRELMDRSYPTEIHVERLAVNRFQIDDYGLPARPTKKTDTRSRRFTLEHGTDSVELDAIAPDTLRSLVRDAIERHMDPERLHALKLAEEQERGLLREVWGGAA